MILHWPCTRNSHSGLINVQLEILHKNYKPLQSGGQAEQQLKWMEDFEVISDIANREVIARGSGIHILSDLRQEYGGRNWRKCKGEATIALPEGWIGRAELHWYEAHGIGRRRMKRKGYLD